MSIVFAISGPFGSDKSSVVKLVHSLLDDIDLAVPYTTRPQMTDNQDNEFFFTTREVFEQMIGREEFLEYVSILGNYYGTPLHYLRQARENGKDLLVEVDERGVAQMKQKVPDAVSILVLPGSSAPVKYAFGPTTDPKLPSFVKNALLPSLQDEVLLPSQISNSDGYDHVIVNKRLKDAANKVIDIVRSERLRRC